MNRVRTLLRQILFPQAGDIAPDHIAMLNARLTHYDEIARLIRSGKTIQAIKLYRDETGATLREAKVAVEKMALDDRREHVPD